MQSRTRKTFLHVSDYLPRRRFLGCLLGACALLLGQPALVNAQAQDEEPLHFPGDPPDHLVVYQFNKADPAYQKAVLFSVSALVRRYGDNIKIAVVAIGPGIHILAKNPGRPVSEDIKQSVSSLSVYGVNFIACGNTMKSLGWTEKDFVPFAQIVEVGAAALMELQEKGYAYISW
jgi:intracellular sulfur oxidation DsrE/DsrF family protein